MTAIILLLSSYATADDPDVVVNTIKYTNDFENGEAITVVHSGKDGGTEYRYRIFNDDDDFPDNWQEITFNDDEWDVGNAPFGNKQNEGINPGTIWQSEDAGGNDGNNDYIILRKDFVIEDVSVILSGTIKSAYTNYYAAFLNGQQIENCLEYSGYCYEGNAEYWNKDINIDTNVFVNGNNTLVLVGRDSLWQGGDNTTWLDGELDLRVQTWNNNQLILGDDVKFKIDFFNNESYNLSNVNVSVEIENVTFKNQTINIQKNSSYEWLIDWTPNRLGYHNVSAKVFNTSMEKIIHVGYYAYSLNFTDTNISADIGESIEFKFEITNEGDVNDTFSFYTYLPSNDWSYKFEPNSATLSPDEKLEIILNVTIGSNAPAESYEMYPIIRSKYYNQRVNAIIESGVENSTIFNYKIWNASEFPNNFYEIGYNDSNWSTGAAPFGDDELNGKMPNTIWQTDDSNYTYITTRHWFNYTGELNFSQIQINIAADNYYRAYLNGELIEDCLSYSWGCYGEGDYWDASINFNNSWLNEGENLLAIAGRDETYQGGNGQQWLDLNLETVDLKSKLWEFDEIYQKLIINVNESYNFSILVPIQEKEVNEESNPYTFAIWIINDGNTPDTYNITVSLNDTTNFSILGYNSNVSVQYGNDGDIELEIMLMESVDEFSLGQFDIMISSLNSTEPYVQTVTVKAKMYVIPDTLPPGTFANSSNLVNSSSFKVMWEIEDWYKNNEVMGNDTKYIIIEYITDNGTNGQNWSEWKTWGNFSTEMEYTTFEGGIDGHKYRFRSVGGDDDNLLENKEGRYDCETTVDLSSPYAQVNLRLNSNLTNLKYFEIEWDVTDYDIIGYEVQYRILTDGNLANWSSWISLDEGSLKQAKWTGFNVPYDENFLHINGMYQFRVLSFDKAGNKGISTPSEKVTVDTIAPNTTIVEFPNFTNALQIEIELENLEDTVNFTLYYSIVDDLPDATHSTWEKYEDYTPNDLPLTINIENQLHYYFKIIAYDEAGNFESSEDYADFIVDRDQPNPIRNLKLTDNKEIVNNTIDIVVSFVQPLPQTSEDIIEYKIYRSNNETIKGDLIGTVGFGEQYLFHRDYSVNLGKIYYYSVVSVDRMGFESEIETEFVDLTIESEPVPVKEEEEESLPFLYLGIGGIIAVLSGGAGYYFMGRSAKETLGEVVAEAVNYNSSNFTEMDGDLLCNECGVMFVKPLPGELITCPSCGNIDE
tara:strand:+ start:4380 stop:8030 length:3651 start_codon:yes stop_codon:yes gene_type:complete